MHNLIEPFCSYLYGQKSLAESTIASYRLHLSRLSDCLGDRTVTALEIEGFFTSLRKTKIKRNTLKSYQVAIKSFFAWQVETGLIVENPVASLRLISGEQISPIIPSVDEVKDMIVSCGRLNEYELRNAAMIVLLAETGVRVGELVQLRFGDVDLQSSQFVLNVVGETKRHIQRSVPFCYLEKNLLVSEIFCAYYFQLLVEKREVADYLFKPVNFYVSKKGMTRRLRSVKGGLKSSSVSYQILQATKRANISKKISPHSLRHFAATNWIINGKNVHEVRGLLGHSTIESTMKYIHLANIYKKDAAKTNALKGESLDIGSSFVEQIKEMRKR